MFAIEMLNEIDALALTSTDKSFDLRKDEIGKSKFVNVKIHDIFLKNRLLTRYPPEKYVWPLFFELRRVQEKLIDPDIFNVTVYDGRHIKLDILKEWYSAFLFDRFEQHMYDREEVS